MTCQTPAGLSHFPQRRRARRNSGKSSSGSRWGTAVKSADCSHAASAGQHDADLYVQQNSDTEVIQNAPQETFMKAYIMLTDNTLRIWKILKCIINKY